MYPLNSLLIINHLHILNIRPNFFICIHLKIIFKLFYHFLIFLQHFNIRFKHYLRITQTYLFIAKVLRYYFFYLFVSLVYLVFEIVKVFSYAIKRSLVV